MYERSSLRYAHTSGYTGLIYIDDGYMLTCGSDGDIRKWQGIDDDDPISNCLGEFVVCLAQRGDKLLASTDHNTVQSYILPDLDKDGTLLRFTAPVIDIKIKDDYIAACSEDTTIKILKGDATQPMELKGHEGPVLALDIHPKNTMLASFSGDGSVKVWDLQNEGKELYSVQGLSKTNSFENAICFGTPCFEPTEGKILIYIKKNEIKAISTTNWEHLFSLNDDKVKGEYTYCQFSQNGLLLAAGTSKGEISIFDFIARQSKKCEGPSSECQSITCLAWSTKNNEELAYCDASGQLGTVFASSGLQKENAAGDDGELLLNNDFDDIEFTGATNDDAERLAKIKAVNDDDDDDWKSIEKLKSKIKIYNGEDLPADEDTKDSVSRNGSLSPCVDKNAPAVSNGFKLQSAFQPSCTPIHLEHRYLVWNGVGIVTSHADGANGAIDVEFHDASVHHSLHIPNYNNHNMASLSSTALVLAGEDSAKVVVIALAASGNKEWSMQLSEEDVVAVVATTKLIAVATSMQFLRIFTITGSQREIISIPGSVICLSGFEDRIMLSYHAAPASQKQQNITAMLLHACGLSLKCKNITLPLTPGRQLVWQGFSDCGSPVFADSMGLVQLFNVKSNCWYPVCDTMKLSSSVSNNYFVISLSERSQILQAVLCRGCSYPMTTPRPLMQELPLQMPLCDLESEKTLLEDSLLRSSIMAVDNANKVIKEVSIKLFALACRGEVETRAKELIETIACPDLLMLAVKYATKLGRIHLADRLTELLPQLEEEQEKRKQDEQLAENTLQPSYPTPTYLNGQPLNNSTKLAPKPMELGSGKKLTLKKFAFNSTSNDSRKFGMLNDSLLATTTDISGQSESILPSYGDSVDDTKIITRSPFNSVNPFASKRKISDIDKGSVLMGSEKLKIARK
ncbi:WD repeat and HMG-box DNA-binding protein 1 [Glossina fuscipes]|uniref:WD repeat and HMG-box DNA-binding protein 1 n=1 Tax=Glossina fuscipes TaxID=7396 RepID=A0A9C5YXC7_9MUSC|nr:WD repeat and HMG-box DNA-binding protein 1 [Glossina fuscipes]